MSDQPQTPDTDDFDPAAHTVAEVNAHLDDAEPGEVARVLAAEADADEPRKGIVEGPHAAVVEEATPEDLLGDDDPYELVRAKDANGTEYTTTRVAAINAGSTVLEHKPATDPWGTPIPTKTVLDLRAEATDPTIPTPEEN